jgi:hypothetical protein
VASRRRRRSKNRGHRGTAPVRHWSRTPRGTAPGWAGCRLNLLGCLGATHFSLGIRSSGPALELTLGASCMATSARMSRVICQKRNFPTNSLFVGTKFSRPFAFATPLYSTLLIDWRGAIGDVFSNPLANSVSGFLHSATAALTFQSTVPTGWYRRGAISAPFSMGAAGISGAPPLSPGCYCTRRIA